MCEFVYAFKPGTYSITKEDQWVTGSGEVPSWKSCTKPIGAVAKKLEYKQNRDNRRCPIAGVYTHVCVWVSIKGSLIFHLKAVKFVWSIDDDPRRVINYKWTKSVKK